MKSGGIYTGWSDGTYRPLQSVKRDAMAAFLQRYDAKFLTPGLNQQYGSILVPRRAVLLRTAVHHDAAAGHPEAGAMALP